MNITTKLDHISSDFITQYLTALGIEDVKRYLKPTKKCFESHWNYENMGKAVEVLNWYIKNNSSIGIICDSDIDGCCSTALIYNFLTSFGVKDIKVYFHEGKQHGIKDKLEEIISINDKNSLLIVPDAGTNDTKECQALNEATIQVLVCDHHEILEDNTYAIVINNQTKEVTNHALSGTGVTDKLVRAYCEKYNINYPNYCDLVAVSLVADICDLTTMENRAYVYYGLKNITNPFLALLFEKLCQRRGYTPDGIGWNIAPLGNALARSNEQESKSLFFDGLIGKIEPEEALKQIRRIKRTQDEEVKSVVTEIEPNLDLSRKVIIGFVQAQNANFMGLIANKFTGKYNKPTILLRDTGYGSWSGSLRSPVPLLEQINKNGIASAQGHGEACGIIVKKNKLVAFTEWLETLDLSKNQTIDVVAVVRPQDITIDLCKEIESHKDLWGKGIESPKFYLKATLTQDNVFVFEKSTTTLKLDINGLGCLKFFANENDINNFKKYKKFTVELILGDLSVNSYNNIDSPQCSIVDYEIIPYDEVKESWEENF